MAGYEAPAGATFSAPPPIEPMATFGPPTPAPFEEVVAVAPEPVATFGPPTPAPFEEGAEPEPAAAPEKEAAAAAPADADDATAAVRKLFGVASLSSSSSSSSSSLLRGAVRRSLLEEGGGESGAYVNTWTTAAFAAKLEGARAGVIFHKTFELGFCCMALILNEMAGRKAQRAILTFVVATFAWATAGIAIYLVPIGYDEAAAGGIITLYLCLLGVMFIFIFVDCCGCKKKDGYEKASTEEK